MKTLRNPLRHTLRHGFFGIASLALLSGLMVTPGRAEAAPVEGAQNAPEPLEYPGVVAPNTGTASVFVISLRDAVENAGNIQLCRVLMSNDKKVIPTPFDWSTCPVNYQNMVKNRQGIVRWASGSKPSECGFNCVSHPQLWRDQNLDRPNTNDVMVSGHIDVEVDVPGPNRIVYFNWRAYTRCNIAPGAREGSAKIDVVVDAPVVGPAGFFEGVMNFFLGPLDWSNRITSGIQQYLSTPAGQTQNLSAIKCSAVGMSTNPDYKKESFEFSHKPVLTVGAPKTATVRLISLTRKPVFNYTPSTPDAGTFFLYINGVPVGIPTVPALAPLPPAGGTTPLNMCKTVRMDGFDRVQVLFTNSLGGTTWSQFGAADGFGVGKTHTMLTGRNIVVPGHAGPGNPHPKPETIRANEYELTYAIEYVDPTGAITPPRALAVGGAGPTAGGGKSPVGASAVTGLTMQQVQTPTAPCRQL